MKKSMNNIGIMEEAVSVAKIIEDNKVGLVEDILADNIYWLMHDAKFNEKYNEAIEFARKALEKGEDPTEAFLQWCRDELGQEADWDEDWEIDLDDWDDGVSNEIVTYFNREVDLNDEVNEYIANNELIQSFLEEKREINMLDYGEMDALVGNIIYFATDEFIKDVIDEYKDQYKDNLNVVVKGRVMTKMAQNVNYYLYDLDIMNDDEMLDLLESVAEELEVDPDFEFGQSVFDCAINSKMVDELIKYLEVEDLIDEIIEDME